MEPEGDLKDYTGAIREMQIKDRAVMDKANRAFVSYIHSYSKHECNVLLRVKGELFAAALVFAARYNLAKQMCPTCRPRFRKTGRWIRLDQTTENARAEEQEHRVLQTASDRFERNRLQVNIKIENKSKEEVAFVITKTTFASILHTRTHCRDKMREKVRQEKLATYRETGVWPASKGAAPPPKKKEAWSERKAEKMQKKERKRVKLEKKEKRKMRKAIDEDDWNEMAREARDLKKFKKKKVSLKR